MDCLFVERELKSANTQVLAYLGSNVTASKVLDCVAGHEQGVCLFMTTFQHCKGCLMDITECANREQYICCVAQGVSGKVKERMQAAAEGTDSGARPMLLFPEVQAMPTNSHMLSSDLTSIFTTNFAPSNREQRLMGGTCYRSRAVHSLLACQYSLYSYSMAR